MLVSLHYLHIENLFYYNLSFCILYSIVFLLVKYFCDPCILSQPTEFVGLGCFPFLHKFKVKIKTM